jgi:hypothetical protein
MAILSISSSRKKALRTRLGQVLDDLARQRADVGAPMPADLGLVAHAAQDMRTNLRLVARAMD